MVLVISDNSLARYIIAFYRKWIIPRTLFVFSSRNLFD